MALYTAWWSRQTDPAVLRLMDMADNDVMRDVLGQGWTEAN
jgi:hypothetical protein